MGTGTLCLFKEVSSFRSGIAQEPARKHWEESDLMGFSEKPGPQVEVCMGEGKWWDVLMSTAKGA